MASSSDKRLKAEPVRAMEVVEGCLRMSSYN